MSKIVDLHVHAFPELGWPGALAPVRSQLKSWVKTLGGALHQAQPSFRHLSPDVRRVLDPISLVSTLPSLLLGSSASDLDQTLDEAGVDLAVVIPSLPYASNTWVAGEAVARKKWIAAFLVTDRAERLTEALEQEHLQGRARILKIHAAMDGAGPASPAYREALEWAALKGVPVILHTGCIQSKRVFKGPEMGRLEHFQAWFTEYPKVTFIAAHMGLHEPEDVLKVAEAHANVSVDTSWQPAEMIGEAVRRLGAERVYFASDWPLLGNNIEVGLRRVREAEIAGWLTPAECDLVLGGNALRLLGWDDGART
jgi:predicted TIM-barrel fold metal-dependent hydrolase